MYALANSYDASAHGTYSHAPIQPTFQGTFEGLGNTISNLSIDSSDSTGVGLFKELKVPGVIANIRLTNVVFQDANYALVGGLAGYNEAGQLFGDFVSGTVAGGVQSYVGGLVGLNTGQSSSISRSYSTAAVTVDGQQGSVGFAGGLVGDNEGMISLSAAMGAVSGGEGINAGGLTGINLGMISNSYATGAVTIGNETYGQPPACAGGLVAYNAGGNGFTGTIDNNYATGAVRAGLHNRVGGLVGCNVAGTIRDSYSMVVVKGRKHSDVGGLLGNDKPRSNVLTDDYWDTTTSGITNLGQGVGNIPNDPGVTGLATTQLQSGLPAGFDPAIWAESANMNGGLPYLLANPPSK
jgi:hypothetical protein